MLSATTTIANPDLALAAGHVRAALERAGVEDLFLTESKDGFVARGIRGRSTAASLAAMTPWPSPGTSRGWASGSPAGAA